MDRKFKPGDFVRAIDAAGDAGFKHGDILEIVRVDKDEYVDIRLGDGRISTGWLQERFELVKEKENKVKEIDPYRKGMSEYRNLSDWKRPMLRKTAEDRFPGIQMLIDGFKCYGDFWSNDRENGINMNGIPGISHSCPECKGVMRAKMDSFYSGGKKIEVWFPQCVKHWNDPDHGYSRLSKHSQRAAMGRPSSDKAPPTPPEPKKEKKPEPKPDPVIPEASVHSQCVRALKYILAGERNLFFTGPAGSGKSYAAAVHIPQGLAADPRWNPSYFHMETTNEMKPLSDFEGYRDRLNGGVYVEALLVRALQMPGVVVVEEADKANANQAGFWNPVLANGKIITPGGAFDRHPDCIVIWIGNTTGHNPSKQYGGSRRQDYATLDRFRVFSFGYEEHVERAAVPGASKELFEEMRKIRDAASKSGFQRILGTRWLKRAHDAMHTEGLAAKEAISLLVKDEGWTDDEKRACGVA